MSLLVSTAVHLGNRAASSTFDFKFTTTDVTGAPTTLGGTPAISVYKDNSVTQTTTGVTLTVDFDGVTGLHNCRIVTTDAFYAGATDFDVVITTGTVGAVSVVGNTVAHFTITKEVVTLADGVAHGGTPGSSTATFAMTKMWIMGTDAVFGVLRAENTGDGPGIASYGGEVGMRISGSSIISVGLNIDGGVNGIYAGSYNGAAIFIEQYGTGGAGEAFGQGIKIVTAGDDGIYIASAGSGKQDINLATSDTINADAKAINGSTAAAALMALMHAGLENGTAQTGSTSTTIKLRAGASAVTDYYKSQVVFITGGTGAGQTNEITAYNGTTKVCTVETTWATTPDNTSVYAVIGRVSP